MADIKLFEVNNSKDEDYSIQTNNKRNPGVTCFPTSMINAGRGVHAIFPKDDGVYEQKEDQYDAFIHSDAMANWYTNKANSGIRNAIKKGTEPRELWEIEEYAFNTWVKYSACKINWKMSKEFLISHLANKGTLVMGGKFAGFGHMVSICGYVSESQDYKQIDKVKFIIIDDSYGNALEKYAHKGSGGNNVKFPIDDFWSITKGDNSESRYGVIFDPFAFTKSPEYVNPKPDAEPKSVGSMFSGFGTALFPPKRMFAFA